MPDLPTITVTAGQSQRILAAFGSTTKYRAWLADQVRMFVKDAERAEWLNTTVEPPSATDPLEGSA